MSLIITANKKRNDQIVIHHGGETLTITVQERIRENGGRINHEVSLLIDAPQSFKIDRRKGLGSKEEH